MSRAVAFQVRAEDGRVLDVLRGSPLWGAATYGLRGRPVGTTVTAGGIRYTKLTADTGDEA